jgi:plastocyanin
MRAVGVLALAAVLAVSGCGGGGAAKKASSSGSAAPAAAPRSGTVAVAIANFKFKPATIAIRKGSSVRWTNNDAAPHSATGDDNAAGPFDTGRLGKGQSKSVTFSKPGTYAYHCVYHPFMTAKLVVSG